MPSEGRSRYNDKQAITLITVHARNIENERNQAQCVFHGYHRSFGGISKSSKSGLVAVGWASWVVKDVGEDLMGWVPRKEKSFHILDNVCSFSMVFLFVAFYHYEKFIWSYVMSLHNS